MDLMLSADQEAIRDAIRDVLRDRFDATRLRAVLEREDRFDAPLWQTGAALGWFGLALPQERGGAGYGVAEAMLLFVEVGRALLTGPWLGTVIAAHALAEAGAEAELAEVIAGRRRVALVDDGTGLTGGDALHGEVAQVLDAGVAGAALVLGPDGGVAYVPFGDEVRVDSGYCIDPTRRVATLRFTGAPARRLRVDGVRLCAMATVFAAAEASGIADRTQDMSVAYGKVREQFGRPIGSFQAIKHRCADMAVRAEVARSAVTYASVAIEEGVEEAGLQVHVAKALATDAAIVNATDNVQNHGGMGYTWEADAHLYLKRARLLEHVLGTRTAHLDAIAAPWRASA